MLHDVRATVRALARRPGLSFTVMLTLTLGIGANSAIFSESNLERRQSTMLVAPGRLEEWQRMNRS